MTEERDPFDLLQPGVVVAGQFTIERELGRGAFGVVYLGQDAAGNRCALKTPRPDRLGRPEDLAMFRREILRWVRLGAHPGIVMAYGMVEFLRLPFVALEYVDGATVLTEVIAGGSTDWRMALSIGTQVARGLDHAQRVSGLIHRDLKPDNILVCPGGQAKVTDFGISFAGRHETAPEGGPQAGTPLYLAPERWSEDATPDVRSDIYALGIILSEVATGRRPYPDPPHLAACLHDHLYTPAADPRALRPEIPAPVAALILRCLAKEPGDRPRDFAEFAEALRDLQARHVGVAPPAGAEPQGPQRAAGRVNLSSTYHQLGLADEAVAAAREALEEDPAHAGAWVALGNGLALERHYPQAVEAFLNAHRLAPDEVAPAANLARCYFEAGDRREALPWLEQALRQASASGRVESLEGITNVLIELGDPGLALHVCDRIVAANPRAALAWNNRAILLRRAGEYDRALESATKAVDLNPAYAKAWSNRATALVGLKRWEEAIASAVQALRFDPSLAGACLAQTAALLASERPAEARSCLEEGLRQQPDNKLLLQALARYFP